ncbi:MAG: hypothetical protein QNK11_06400 [Legionella sp.]|nr:hypothetical protein [Legionella sp.]
MIGSYFQSFLFAQVFGLYFVIMSIILISRADYYKVMIGKLKTPGPGLMMTASLSLFVSLFLVVVHNIWVFGPRVYVTIICWLFLIKSVCWLAAPERMLAMAKKLWAGRGHYVISVIVFIIGIYMMVRGFYVFMLDAGALPMGAIS